MKFEVFYNGQHLPFSVGQVAMVTYLLSPVRMQMKLTGWVAAEATEYLLHGPQGIPGVTRVLITRLETQSTNT